MLLIAIIGDVDDPRTPTIPDLAIPQAPPIEGGYFSYLPDEILVTYILYKDLMKILKMSNTSKAIKAKLEGGGLLRIRIPNPSVLEAAFVCPPDI